MKIRKLKSLIVFIILIQFFFVSCESKQRMKIKLINNIEVEMYSKLDRSIFTSIWDDDPFENFWNFHGKRFDKIKINNQDVFFELFVNEYHDEIVSITCLFLKDSTNQKIIDSLHFNQFNDIINRYHFKEINIHNKNRNISSYYKNDKLNLINIETFEYKDMIFQGFMIYDSELCNLDNDIVPLFKGSDF